MMLYFSKKLQMLQNNFFQIIGLISAIFNAMLRLFLLAKIYFSRLQTESTKVRTTNSKCTTSDLS